MADPDDHAAAVQFESTYDVMFYVGNPSNEIKTADSSTTMESDNVTTSMKSHRESRTITKKEIRHTSSKSKISEIRQSSSSSKMCDMSVETKEVQMQSSKAKVSETVTYSNGPNTDNGRASEDRNTSPPASMLNRSSRSPRSPASPTTLSPQSPTHWSVSSRTSPSISNGWVFPFIVHLDANKMLKSNGNVQCVSCVQADPSSLRPLLVN